MEGFFNAWLTVSYHLLGNSRQAYSRICPVRGTSGCRVDWQVYVVPPFSVKEATAQSGRLCMCICVMCVTHDSTLKVREKCMTISAHWGDDARSCSSLPSRQKHKISLLITKTLNDCYSHVVPLFGTRWSHAGGLVGVWTVDLLSAIPHWCCIMVLQHRDGPLLQRCSKDYWSPNVGQ